MADSSRTPGQPCLVLDPTQSSMLNRNTTVGETTLVPAHLLHESNFQKVYKGTGTPERPNAEDVLRSVSTFAEELAVPLFGDSKSWFGNDVSKSEAATRREHFAARSSGKAGAYSLGVVSIIGGSCGAYLAPLSLVMAAPAAVVAPLVVAAPLVFMGVSYKCNAEHNRHLRRQNDAAQIVDSSKKAIEDLKTNFRLESPEGPFVLYSSESMVVENYKWQASGSETCEAKGEKLKFYKALNKVLAQDDFPRLKAICPFIKMLNYYVNMTRYPGGTVYSGVSVAWKIVTPLLRKDTKLRIPRVLSTSQQRHVARDHAEDKEGLTGLLLVIVIPDNFWGARDLADVSKFPEEAEVVFPPWSQFVVRDTTGLDRKPPELHLEAIDKYAD